MRGLTMDIQEKINTDFGLWQLHLGVRRLELKLPVLPSLAIKITIPESGKSALRQLITELLKVHSINLSAIEVIDLLRRQYNYQAKLTVPSVANMLPHIRNNIKRGISDELIIKLYETHSGDDVAAMLGLSSATVRNRLRQNGVTIRDRQSAKVMLDNKRRNYGEH